MNEGKFKLFNDCYRAASKDLNNRIKAPESKFVMACIKQGQRFYAPYGAGIFAGKSYSDISHLMTIPFPVMAVAAESIADGSDDPTDIIQTVICLRQRDDDPKSFDFVYGLNDLQSQNGWLITPQGRCNFKEDGTFDIGIVNGAYGREMLKEFPEFRPKKYWNGGIGTVHSLCGMLALKNVQTKRVDPPEKLNKKRVANGNKPLYSYHVLNVGGEVWDSAGVDTGDGQGFRSHLRRGHIRRLSDDRCVWVRATYVHGRIAGFVDKDYNVMGVSA